MFGLPNFVFYLIAGVFGAFGVSLGRWLGEKLMPDFPDMPLLLSRLIDWGKPEPEKTARVMGSYFHLITGSLWGLAFGLIVEKQFFLVEFNIFQGMMFAVLPWLFLMVIVMPLVKGGFFAFKINKYHS